MTLLDAMRDPQLFGRWFAAPSWRPWTVCLSAIFGLPIVGDDLDAYRRHTGRTVAPSAPAREAWIICGRRGGKSRIAALVTTYLAAFRDHRTYLAPGERAVVPVIAVDRRAARAVFRYVHGLLHGVPMLERLIEAETAESIDLSTGATIEIATASFRSARSFTSPAAVVDEIAYLRTDDSATPDRELLAALRPSMATVPGGGMLIAISSPYARRGCLYEAHQRHYGQDGDPVLVWQAASRDMHPSLSSEVIAQAYADDASAAASEYGGLFRADLESFIDFETLRACVVADRAELPPADGVRYAATIDAAGGAGRDSFTACVAHRSARAIVIDRLIEIRPPFSPDAATEQIAAALRPYGIGAVVADRFGGEWVAERLRRHGLGCMPSAFTRSEAYLAALPWLTGRRVELLDQPRLLSQFAALERRTAASGRDTVDHPSRGGIQHDDVANVCALVIAEVAKCDPAMPPESSIIWG